MLQPVVAHPFPIGSWLNGGRKLTPRVWEFLQRGIAYSYGAECPASHPIRIPEVQFYFRVAGYEGGHHLFADGGAEVHADYFSGWDQQALQKVLDECENESEAGDTFPPSSRNFPFPRSRSTRHASHAAAFHPPAALPHSQH